MKRIAAMLVALCIVFSVVFAGAEMASETTEISVYDKLTVASTAAMDGNFFLERWGSNAADMDVQTLLHAYSLVEWKRALGTYGTNNAAVSGIVVTQDADGNRTYTIALADGIAYSDGTPITAWDYAFSVLLAYSPKLSNLGGKAPGNGYYVGLSEYAQGATKTISGVRVLGKRQLAITVKAEFLPFFYELALLSIKPYPIHVIAPGCMVVDDGEGVYIANDDNAAKDTRFTERLLRKTILDPKTGYLSHPSVVSGPYTLESYDRKSATATFAINPYFRGNSAGKLPRIASITFTATTNEQAARQFASGEIGLLSRTVQASTIDSLMQQIATNNVAMSNYTRNGYSFISFNCERAGVADASVRQAISLCFDKDTFIAGYVGPYGLRVDGCYGIGQWAYRAASGTMQVDVPAPAEDATQEEIAAYEQELEAWASMSMADIPVYHQDVQAAVKLLEQNGWTLNRSGAAFDAQQDDVRCKQVDGRLIPLELSMIYPEGNAIGTYLDTVLIAPLKEAGIVLTAEERPFSSLLRQYYRQEKRDCDMIYLATNYSDVYDLAPAYNPADAAVGLTNRTGIADEELYGLAVALRNTEPNERLTYCQRWIEFQKRFAQVVPAIPVYSNAYFDFYTSLLHEYAAADGVSWAEAIIGAYLSDVHEGDVAAETELPADEEPVFEE